MSLKNRVIFITGASAGIGAACARRFAEAGANLILAARRANRLRELAREVESAFGIRCHFRALDVRHQPDVEQFMAELPPEFAAIDILVNNAGLSRGLDPIPQGKIDDWDEMVDTNVKGLLFVTRAVTPGMLERGQGHIINIGSIAGRQVYPNGGVYCATKFAVRAITQGLMMDLVNTPLRVTTVDPGLTETEFSLVRFRGDKERAANVYRSTDPLTADDIADAVLYCATRPPRMNVAEMVVMPTTQASVYHLHKYQVSSNKLRGASDE